MLAAVLFVGGCCTYPRHYHAADDAKTARAVLASPKEIEAYLGSNFKVSALPTSIKCPPNPLLKMAPVGTAENGKYRFGAFAIRHGNKQDAATVYWWSRGGTLRSQTVHSADASPISFEWINERTVRMEWGTKIPGSQVIQLDDSDFECSFPYQFAADGAAKAARAVVASRTSVEAYLGGSFARVTLDPPLNCPPHPVVSMAPVAPEEEGIVRFGAFAVGHGPTQNNATVLWWNKQGKLQSYHVTGRGGARVTFSWINERTIRFQLGKAAQTVRLNDDDGPPYSILK